MLKRLLKLIRKHWLAILVLGTLSILAAGLVFFAVILKDLPSPDQFETRQVAQSTKIYDRTGTVLLYEIHGEEKRTTIPFDSIPDTMKQATISIEDHTFYTNPGFDWRGILRSALADLVSSSYSQGGSTITQQLARNAFLSTEKTIVRKIKELMVAFQLEQHYTKDEILNLYLNQIPYGSNAYGVEAAAETYFNKHASELNLAESALLASLPQAPSYYSPYGKHVDELMQRKDLVLQKMNEYGYITDQQMKDAQNFKIQFAPSVTTIKAPHFVLEVQDYLNKKYGEDYVQTAGLRVITTLDWNMQQEAEKAVLDGATRNTELYQGYNAALVAQDATTGQILALVGSKDYFGSPEPDGCTPGVDCKFEGNFDVATQGLRQPGSSMKPFAYTAAFEKGYTPDTTVFDLSTEFDTTGDPANSYKPVDFEGTFAGPVTFRTALAQSINVPAVKVMYLAGIDNVLSLAHDFGISTLTERSRYGLSLVLGGGEVTLKDMVGAYSVFAQEGVKHQQTMILSVTDAKGNIVEQYQDNSQRVIDAQYTRLTNDILTDVKARSGLFQSSLALTVFPGHEVAMKTGTTNDYRDAWTIGYTPDLVVGVWSGNNDNTPMQRHGSSLLAAVPMWSAFMSQALQNRPLVSFNKPDPIVTQKPMFNDDYIENYTSGNQSYPQVHTILFYVDKNNPLGPQPTQPENDPQFKNWEDPVLQWATSTIPDFLQKYNRPIPFGAQNAATALISDAPTLTITAPQNGQFISGQVIPVTATIAGKTGLTHLQLLFNNTVMDDRSGSLGSSFTYQFSLVPHALLPQNRLTLRVTDGQNNSFETSVILYQR
ncbi:MAG: PBP1A family penicillin-binding protein [Patescibacteria group bacterium]|nr:PBP1A family penicillin-binding protein [Patescibacteria group bacterium]